MTKDQTDEPSAHAAACAVAGAALLPLRTNHLPTAPKPVCDLASEAFLLMRSARVLSSVVITALDVVTPAADAHARCLFFVLGRVPGIVVSAD